MSTTTPAVHTGSAATAPAGYGVAVTPSDSTVFYNTRALYIGTGGNVTVEDINGIVTYANVPSGSVLPVQVKAVRAANTTATNIVALY